MVKLTDITTKVYQRHLDGKTCACILHGSELAAYFDVENQFDETDRQAALDFIEHRASPKQKSEFHLWFQLMLQLRNQLNVLDAYAQELLGQLSLRTTTANNMTAYLKQEERRLNAPKVFDSQAKAKAYLTERDTLATQAIHATPIGLNQWLKQCFKDIDPSKEHWRKVESTEALHHQRYQAWRSYCDEHFSEPLLGDTFFQFMARRDRDPQALSLASTLPLTLCYQEVFGDTFIPLMRRAASKLKSLIKKHKFIALSPSDPVDDVVGLTVKGLNLSNWLSVFIEEDGFCEDHDDCCDTVSLSALAQANIDAYAMYMRDEIGHYLQLYWPRTHRQPALVRVQLAQEQAMDFTNANGSEFASNLVHLVPALYMTLANDAHLIKQVKASNAILECLAKLTGLSIGESKLAQVDADLMIAYQVYNQARLDMCTQIALHSLESIANTLGIDADVIEKYVDASDYRAVQVPQSELANECERWFNRYLSEGKHDQKAEAFNQIVQQPWGNIEINEATA